MLDEGSFSRDKLKISHKSYTKSLR